MKAQASESSSGASFMMSRNARTTSCARSARNRATPAKTSGPSGWSASSSDVTTPKLPPPPRSAQSSSGFSTLGRANDPTVPGHELGADEVVAGEAVLALEPPGAAAERQSGNPGRRHAPARGGQAVGLGDVVHVGPDGTAADADAAPVGVDVDVGHAAQVKHEAVVAQRQTGDGVPTGADSDRQRVVLREGQCRDHVVDGQALGHEQGSALDHRVEQRGGVLVVGVAGFVHAALQAEAELFETSECVGD